MGHHRVKEEELGRIQLRLRYVGLDVSQFHWQCLKLVAASEELTETDILRRIVRLWSETLSPAVREKAQRETARLEAWKAQVLCARRGVPHSGAKHAKLSTRRQLLTDTRKAANRLLSQK
jgi:hypothetical protein